MVTAVLEAPVIPALELKPRSNEVIQPGYANHTMGLVGVWVKADAWFRKQLRDGTYLIVSYYWTGFRGGEPFKQWTWRHTSYHGNVLMAGIGDTEGQARNRADKMTHRKGR